MYSQTGFPVDKNLEYNLLIYAVYYLTLPPSKQAVRHAWLLQPRSHVRVSSFLATFTVSFPCHPVSNSMATSSSPRVRCSVSFSCRSSICSFTSNAVISEKEGNYLFAQLFIQFTCKVIGHAVVVLRQIWKVRLGWELHVGFLDLLPFAFCSFCCCSVAQCGYSCTCGCSDRLQCSWADVLEERCHCFLLVVSASDNFAAFLSETSGEMYVFCFCISFYTLSCAF